MNSLNWLVMAPEIALLALTAVVALVDLWVTDERRNLTFVLALGSVAIVAALHLVAYADGHTYYVMQRMVVADPLGHLLAAFAAIATFVALVYARGYARSRDMLKGELFSLTLFSLLGIFIMVSANNFVVIYLGLELMSLSLYALTAMRRDHAPATEAAMKYFVLGALASGFLLYGMSMMYGATGSLEIAEVLSRIAKGDVNHWVLLLGLVFLVAGLGFKLGAVPFHMWVPDVYQGAPTAVTLLIGGAPKLAAFGITIRVLVEGLIGLAVDWQQMLIVLSVGSMALGNLAAIAQTNIKRMLAYSTIAHTGFMLLGLCSGVVAGNTLSAANAYSSAMFYMVAYVVATLGTFGVLMLLSRPGHESDQLSDIKGLARKSPWYAGVMALLVLSLAGIPPTMGFYAKLSVLQALISANVPGYTVLAVVAVVLSLIGAFYYLRIIKLMFFDAPVDASPIQADTPTRVVLSVNGAAILILGVLPGGLMALCARAIVQALAT